MRTLRANTPDWTMVPCSNPARSAAGRRPPSPVVYGRGRAARYLLFVLLMAAPVARAQDSIDAVRREMLPTARIPAGKLVFVRGWSAVDGPGVNHAGGRIVADPEARGARAVEARVGIDAAGKQILYGPYAEFPAGDYVAFFRLKLLEEAGEETVGTLDASANNGQDILRAREITGSDMAAGRYAQVPLAFRSPGGKLECRVAWAGFAGLRVDSVSLFRLDSGRIDDTQDRVQQPTPTGRPNNLVFKPEERPFADLFPRSSPPAQKLLVIDTAKLPPDWQLLVASLQGIVNRKQPRIYCLANPPDSQWLSWIVKNGWVKSTEQVEGAQDLLARFRSEIKGIVITDPKLPDTKNVATMIAAVEDAMVTSPRIAQTLHLPVIQDLRGRWTRSMDAQRWAFDNLWPRLNHFVIACLWPGESQLRDYLVENRVFTFWLPGPIDGARPYNDAQAELALMEELLAKMPPNIPVMGYPWAGKDVGIGEGPGVTLFAEFAKYLVGSVNCSNLSVHSGIRTPPLLQKPAPPAPNLNQAKVYVSWVISDGDNLPVLTTGNFPKLWAQTPRGKFPIGWTASPSASMLIPDIVRYYYRTSTPADCWMAAVSGIGYTYPDSYGARFQPQDRRKTYDGFLDLTSTYMRRMDESLIWPMNVTRDELIAQYAERIPFLRGIFPDYGRRVADYGDATYPVGSRSTPVFHAVLNWADGMPRDQQIASIVSQIKGITPTARPAFLHLFVLNWFADLPMLQEVLKRLGPDYVCVRPDHLVSLYNEELARMKVFVRAPAAASGIEGTPIAFTADVRNVTKRALPVAAAIKAGLRDAQTEPGRSQLAPGESVSVHVSGLPVGRQVQLSIRSPLGASVTGVRLHVIPLGEINGPLPTKSEGALRFVRRFEAVDMPHRSGRAAADPAASEKRVWQAIPGQAEPGWILYGPYAPMPAGKYVAFFRIKGSWHGSGEVARMDASSDGGKKTMAERTITTADTSAGTFFSYPLTFDHPGGALETRVFWQGNSPIELDSIDLFQVVPAAAPRAEPKDR